MTPDQVAAWLRGKATALDRAAATKRRRDPGDQDAHGYKLAAAHLRDLADQLEQEGVA